MGRRRIFASRSAGWKVGVEGAIVVCVSCERRCSGREGEREVVRRKGKGGEVCLLKIWGRGSWGR